MLEVLIATLRMQWMVSGPIISISYFTTKENTENNWNSIEYSVDAILLMEMTVNYKINLEIIKRKSHRLV